MPVDSQHPEYSANKKRWQRMRDSIAGDDAIQSAGVRYLPELSGQTPAEYAAYLRRGVFFGATGRTSAALHGLIFRKPAIVECPASLNDVFEDITMSGKSAAELSEDIARELIDVGRVGVLVDFPAIPEGVTISNAAAAAAMGLRPYATVYKAETILNWGVGRVRNRSELMFLALDESGIVQGTGADYFEHVAVERIRVVKLDEAGLYVQEVYEKGPNGWEIKSQVFPTSNGKRLDRIPFVIGGASHMSADVARPPMLDLADVNLSHFRTSADLEHGAHFTGLPTAWISGYSVPPSMNYEGAENRQAPPQSFAIGSSSAWVFENPETKVGYLEFTGNGLGTLERLMDRKEKQMANLGARLLTGEKAGVEATATLEIRTSGETSVLSGIATTTGRMMTTVCELIAQWKGIAGKVLVTVNKDFIPSSMSPQLLAQLFAMLQGGAISPQTFFWNLQDGEIIPDGKTFEDEEAQIAASAPSVLVPAPTVKA